MLKFICVPLRKHAAVNKMNKKQIATSMVMCSLLLGCGEDGNMLTEPDVTATDVEVISWTITGTSERLLENMPIPIDANENGGRFSVAWEIQANGTVRVGLSVSESSVPSAPNSNFRYFNEICPKDGVCTLTDSLECTFTTEASINCENANGTNIEMLMDSNPYRAQLFIYASAQNKGRGLGDSVEFRR